MSGRTSHKQELFWPRVVVRKLLNISPKESDYSADTDDDDDDDDDSGSTAEGRFTDLYGLNYLNLSDNKFEGGIPFGFRNLQQLRVLDLHWNDFFSDVGEFFSELRNVEHVDLSYNRFYGGLSVPSENVSGLANTVCLLNLSYNSLNVGFLKGTQLGYLGTCRFWI